jgi:PfaB family protein
MGKFINNQNPKLAIVGMNINWNSCETLDAFERIIYEGKQAENASQPNSKITQVAKKAFKDAKIDEKQRVAVIIATEEENIPSLICQQENFSCLPFNLTTPDKSVFGAIQMAQKLLQVREVDAVLVGANSLQGAGALVLKLDADARKNQQRIYATIDALTMDQNSEETAQTVTQTCQQTFNIAGVKPEEIGYLEICDRSILEPSQLEIKGLIAAYQTSSTELTCAVGSIKSNIGNTAASEIASLIKTALCLYYRYIPAVPQWNSPKEPELWRGSPFYIDTQSKPWFLAAEANQRFAAINSFSNGKLAHLILSSAPSQELDSRYLQQIPYYLFPLAADETSELLKQIEALEKTILESDSLTAIAAQTFTTYQKHENATYAVAILGRNLKELQREIQRAVVGVKNAFETGEDWKTPVGSYFTAKPLGKKGKVAFVYPGAYSSYVGIARNLFRLFPKIWDSPVIQSVYSRVASIEKLLYPRSLSALTKRQLEDLEKQLIDNPLSMLESEVGFAGLMSAVLRDYFALQPDCCFGYSVGETSMAIAQGIWTGFNQTSSGLNSSELFTTRLSGDKNAVREYWGLTDEEVKGEFWRNYLLMADVSQVKKQLKNESRVYLTQINTSKEVVIAGDKAACQRVIKAIGCNAIPAPFNHVIHCEAMASEYNELVKLHTLPIRNKPKIEFYSAAEYGRIKLDGEVMGNSIAKVLCQQFDFPRIINCLYASGARIFVEVGAGNACSRWIGENLKQQEHTTIFLNRRGVNEHTTLLRGLAQLFSHRVSLDLSPLYCHQQQPIITTSNNEIQNQNQEILVTLSPHYWGKFSMEELNISANLIGKNPNLLNYLDYEYNPVDINHQIDLDSTKVFTKIVNQPKNNGQVNTELVNHKLSNFFSSNCKKLSESNQQCSEAHTAFLQNRKSSFGQMVKMVELQLSVLSTDVFDPPSPPF